MFSPLNWILQRGMKRMKLEMAKVQDTSTGLQARVRQFKHSN